jgi:isopentenyl-diphosphate delta-isomerase
MAEMIPAWVDGKLAPVEKMAVHVQGLRHKAVSVFLLDGEKVLIQRRADGKYHSAGLWANTCCTHPHWGETPVDCAVRRMREELGITGIYPAFADRVEYRADVGQGLIEHEVVDIYLAYGDPDTAIAPDPNEVSEVRWVDLYDLAADVARHPDHYTKWLAIYMDSHIERIFDAVLRG